MRSISRRPEANCVVIAALVVGSAGTTALGQHGSFVVNHTGGWVGGLSGDGSTIVGETGTALGRWVNDGPFQYFGATGSGGVCGASADGSVCAVNASPNALRWRDGTGVAIGSSGMYWATPVSGNGDVVAFNPGGVASTRATRWTAATGAQQLAIGGFLRTYAAGISNAGDAIVGDAGDAQGHEHPVRWLMNGPIEEIGRAHV